MNSQNHPAAGAICKKVLFLALFLIIMISGNSQNLKEYLMGMNYSVSDTAGILYDSEGPYENYGNGLEMSFLIQPPCADTILLIFNQFELASGDYLYVYDGTGSYFPLLYKGSLSDMPDTLVATSGSVYFHFRSDFYETGPGFAVKWLSINEVSGVPVATFSMSKDPVPSAWPVILASDAEAENHTFKWIINDQLEGTSKRISYSFNEGVSYEIVHVVSNCLGSDTTIKTIQPSDLPSVLVAPGSINASTSICNDTIDLQFDIANSGSGLLAYAILNASGDAFDSLSMQYYYGSGETTTHNFALPFMPSVSDTLYLQVVINGDYDGYNEYASLRIGNLVDIVIPDNNMYNGADIEYNYVLTGNDLIEVMNGNHLTVWVVNSPAVDDFGQHYHKVNVRSSRPRYNVEGYTGFVNPSSSESVILSIPLTEVASGILSDSIRLITNDPDMKYPVIPYSIDISGYPQLGLSDTLLDFGSHMLQSESSKSLYVSNHGCDTLKVNEITFGSSSFYSIGLDSVIMPWDSTLWIIGFKPSSEELFDTQVWLSTNDKDTIIHLKGVGTYPPEMVLVEDTFDVNLTYCDDSTAIEIEVQNTGNTVLQGAITTVLKNSNLYFESFENGLDSWEWSGSELNPVIVSNAATEGDYSLRITGKSNFLEALHYKMLPSDYKIVEYDFKVNSTSGYNNYFEMTSGELKSIAYSYTGYERMYILPVNYVQETGIQFALK